MRLPCSLACPPLMPLPAAKPGLTPQTQILICGNPPGSGMCSATDYDPSLPVLAPDSVSYNGKEYTGGTVPVAPAPARCRRHGHSHSSCRTWRELATGRPTHVSESALP